MLRRPKELL
jgi:hypothetical protein